MEPPRSGVLVALSASRVPSVFRRGHKQRVQPVAQRRVRLGEQVGVAVQHEAGRGVPGPHRDLLRGGARSDPQRHCRVAKVVDAKPR
jgi:hypothetical protein